MQYALQMRTKTKYQTVKGALTQVAELISLCQITMMCLTALVIQIRVMAFLLQNALIILSVPQSGTQIRVQAVVGSILWMHPIILLLTVGAPRIKNLEFA